MLAKLIENPEVVSFASLKLLLRIAHDILLAGAGWIILTVGSQLPVFFHPDIAPVKMDRLFAAGDKLVYVAEGFAASHPAWTMLAISGIVMLILVVVYQVQDYRIRPAASRAIYIKRILAGIAQHSFHACLDAACGGSAYARGADASAAGHSPAIHRHGQIGGPLRSQATARC